MLYPDTTAPLPAVRDELCESVLTLEFSMRAGVASAKLEVAKNGERSIDHLKHTGRDALDNAPTMWR